MRRGEGMHMKTVAACYPIDLRDDRFLVQDLTYLLQRSWRRLQFDVTRDRPADLLRIDDRRISFDDALLFQRLHPELHCHPGKADLLADIRVGHAGIADQQLHDLLICFIQSIQKHRHLPFCSSMAHYTGKR